MRLKDLVHRSALRTRSAGETEIAAPPVVFEVTDLLIPAGTDWSAAPHIIGTLEVERAVGVQWVLAIRVDHEPDPDTAVYLGFTDARSRPLSDDSYFDRAFTVTGASASTNTNFFVSAFSAGFDGVEYRTFDIGLWTAGAMPSDITVVRARAAFLVI